MAKLAITVNDLAKGLDEGAQTHVIFLDYFLKHLIRFNKYLLQIMVAMEA